MNQEKIDQEWDQLELRINQFVGRFLRNDVAEIEYKPHSLSRLEPPQKNIIKKKMKNVLS